MKIITAFFVLTFISLIVNAQDTTYRQGCDFLSNLKFRNGVDTIFVLATNKASIKPPPYLNISNNLRTLCRLKKLDIKDFIYCVDFKPLHCNDEYNIDCKDYSEAAFNSGGKDQEAILKFRCIVFEGYFEGSRPYFIIDKITAN